MLLLTIAFLLCLTFYIFCASWELIYEDVSPNSKGSAVFYSPVDFGGWTVELYVHDYSKAGRDSVLVTVLEASDSEVHYSDAVWSADGTVIVVNMSGSRENDPTIGYDFQNHTPITSSQRKLLMA